MKTLITNGAIINADETLAGDVLIDGEKIAVVGAAIPKSGVDRVIDAAGKLIMPGGIDVHTHLEMPVGDIASSDDFFTGHRAAAFGGTTTHLDFANQAHGQTLRDTINAWHSRANPKAVIDYGYHITVVDGNDAVLAEIAELKSMGVNTVKMLMAYKGRVMVDDETLFKVMQKCAEQDLLVMTHCENGDAIYTLQNQALAAGHTEPIWHALTRPALLEAEATNRAIKLAEVAGCRLYVVHVTNAGSLEAIALSRAKGNTKLNAETCIQYFFFTKDDLKRPNFEGAKWICSPPFREASDPPALWAGVAKGDLDIVSTDHCPWLMEHRLRGLRNFMDIPNGVPSIEHRMTLLWHFGVGEGRITPQRFVQLTAANPAKLFGIPQKGRIAPGLDADVLVWDPNAENVISAKTHKMRVDYDCWEGTVTRGKPAQVLRRGELLVDGDAWLGVAGSGQYLRRA
ncbi:MAG TPA: dihydropyrimidinase [Thermoflexales bacterium]|nr:dihydropyrimidinase [Thermoflexales bacterium]